MDFLLKIQLFLLQKGKFCSGMKACHIGKLKTSSNNVIDKTHWDADGPNGPDTDLNSMSILLAWLCKV
jgi:hypothetical protein